MNTSSANAPFATPPPRSRRWRPHGSLPLLAGAGLLALLAGCVTPGAQRDDIVTVYHYYRVEPWIRDEVGRVNGFLSRVYFVPSGDNKGYFVPSTITAQIFTRDRLPDGTYSRTLVHDWSFNQQQAEGFRIVKRSELGDSYGFVLRWPHELDLSGREIEVRFGYVRKDGHTIVGRGTPLLVPLATGQFAGGTTTAPATQSPTTRPAPAPPPTTAPRRPRVP